MRWEGQKRGEEGVFSLLFLFFFSILLIISVRVQIISISKFDNKYPPQREVSSQTQSLSDYLITRPSKRGIVLDWELQKEIWQFAFESLGVQDLSKYHLFLTEPPCSPQQLTEEDGPGLTLSVCFEDFGLEEFL